jgi:hypothetical protein
VNYARCLALRLPIEIKEEIVSMEPVIEKTRSRLDEWPLMDRKSASKCELDAGAVQAGINADDVQRRVLLKPSVMQHRRRPLFQYRLPLQLNELQAAREAGVDALVAVYHSDHPSATGRSASSISSKWLTRAWGCIGKIVSGLIAKHSLDAGTARNVVVKVLLGDQPLPLKRGSNENTNRLLRQYLPRGTDLSLHSQAKLSATARQLNERPRKPLLYQTPADKFAECVAATS